MQLVDEKQVQKPTTMNLFGYEGEYAKEFNILTDLEENRYNWEDDPDLSVEEKIAILENMISENRQELKSNRRRELFG